MTKPNASKEPLVKTVVLLVIGAVLGVCADLIVRPYAAGLFPAPKVNGFVIAHRAIDSGMPCARVSLLVQPDRNFDVDEVRVELEFDKPVASYQVAGQSFQRNGREIELPSRVLDDGHSCAFSREVKELPPEMTANLLPEPANTFKASLMKPQYPLAAEFILPPDSGATPRISVIMFYQRFGVTLKRDVPMTKTVQQRLPLH